MLQLRNKPHNGRAKDGETGMSLGVPGGMVRVDRMAGGRIARPQSLAVAGVVERDAFCPRAADRHHLAASRWYQHRLRRLLLLPGRCWTQERMDRVAVADLAAADFAAAPAAAGGDRRFSDQA